MADPLRKIERLIAPTLEDMGYELIRVMMTGNDRRPTLQIMAERQDGTMNIDDCAVVSRAISAVLDVEDPINEKYTLEVSSPGIDRPLTRLKDYERFKGHEARIETTQKFEGQRRFKGVLNGTEDDCVLLLTDDAEMVIPLSTIQKAKLLLTEALLEEAAKAQEARKKAESGAEEKDTKTKQSAEGKKKKKA